MNNHPPGNPSESSIWKPKDFAESPFKYGKPHVYLYSTAAYESDGVRRVCYIVCEYTNLKMATEKVLISRDCFFDWFEPYILTDADRRRY